MLKRSLLALGVALMSMNGAFALDRADRVTGDEVVRANIAAMETKYGVQCEDAHSAKIRWMCLNGPGCGYVMHVTCPKTTENGVKIGGMQLKISGFDTGTRNDVNSIEFLRLR